ATSGVGRAGRLIACRCTPASLLTAPRGSTALVGLVLRCCLFLRDLRSCRSPGLGAWYTSCGLGARDLRLGAVMRAAGVGGSFDGLSIHASFIDEFGYFIALFIHYQGDNGA